MIKFSFKTLLCGVLLFGNVCYGQSKIMVTPGQKIHLVNVTKSNIHQTIAGQEMDITANVTLEADVTVKDISNNINLSLNITHILLTTEAMGNTINFDSDKKEDMDGQVGQALKGAINKQIDAVVDMQGKAVKGGNMGLDDAAASLIGDNLDALYGECFLAVAPSVKAGDKFTDSTGSTATGDKTSFMYDVQSVNAGVATIGFSASQVMKKEKKIQGMDAVINGSVDFSGTLNVDVKTGVVKDKKTIANGKGTTEVMGQSIPFTLKTDVGSNTK